jgi:hypothetical protein
MREDLDHPGRTSGSARRVLTVASVIAVVALGLFALVGGLGNARNAEERIRCQRILEAVFASLDVNHHDSPPRVSGGSVQAGIRNLAAAVGDRSFTHSGLTRDVSEAYVVAPELDAAHLVAEEPRVLACDKPGNHVLRLRNGLRERRNGKIQEQALLLLSTGDVVAWVGDSDEYRKWVDGFAAGKGSAFPPGMEERILEWRRRTVHNVTEPTDAADSR